MNPLFNSHRLALKVKDSKLETNKVATQIFANWHHLLSTTTKTEEQLQADFLNDIFGEVLGYAYKRGLSEFNLEKEESTQLDGKQPDGILGFFNINQPKEQQDVRVIIELKGSKANLDAKQNRDTKLTPVEQAFGYVSKYQKVEFVIVSNFKEIRLYQSNYQGKYHQFLMSELASQPAKQQEFYFLLCKHNLIGFAPHTGSIIKKLIDDQAKHETEIQNKFYFEYKTLREEFVNSILKQNQTTPETAIAKAQKLFDRLLFVRFCEDNNLLHKPFEKVYAGQALGLSLFDSLKMLFQSIDKGNPPHIHKFNGGLFATDEVFDSIKIETKLLEKLIAFLRLYHFKNDISVHILGHIFEQSLTDLENLKAGLNSETHNKKEGKRKKDGIFYTPEYITKYIVAEALGSWLKEQKDALQLRDFVFYELPENKPKKWQNPNQELINRYKLYAEKLKSVKVLDPACGSGAFLVEVFNYLQNEWLELSQTLQTLGDEAELELFNYRNVYKSILQNNIYGIDLNSESVQITKLSLWLKTANSQDELTTLDNNIKIGNSLIDDVNLDEKAFNWQQEFPFKFDVVVGNPPYGVNLNEKQKEYLSNFDSLVPDYEIYIYFISKGLHLLSDNGRLFYIFPNTFLSTLYGLEYRKRIIENNSLINITNLSDDKTFEYANVRTCICGFQKTKNDYECKVVKYDTKFDIIKTVTKKDLIYNCENLLSFISVNESEQRLIDKIKLHSKLLNFFDVSQGYIPYDKYRGQSEEIIKNRIYHSSIKLDETYKIEIKGKDVKPYHLNLETDQYVKYGKHLANPREQKYFINPRLLIREIVSDKLIATYTEEECYNNPSVVNIIAKKDNSISLFYILTIINSKLIGLYHNATSPKSKKGLFPKILINDIRNLPVPQISLADQQPFIEKAQTMLDLTKQLNSLSFTFLDYLKAKMGNPSKLSNKLLKWYNLPDDAFLTEINKLAKTQKLANFDERAVFVAFKTDSKKIKEIQQALANTDAEIDRAVYALYKLSEEEIGVVENL
ncbi:MAG: hypothetical protein EBT55_00735 [Proteobacteria bacterium]|nr:hypothetical protein [Pseudomonadota bacterium]